MSGSPADTAVFDRQALGHGSAMLEATERPPSARAAARAFLRVGVASSLWAAAVMAATLMAIGEIAANPTAVPGIRSDTWTPLTGITSFFLGSDALHGGFAILSILFGALVHLVASVLFGLVGAAVIVTCLGWRPGPGGAAGVGVAYGFLLEVAAVNLVVNNVQGVDTVYTSVPPWAWFVAHGAYGATLGVAFSRLSRSPILGTPVA